MDESSARRSAEIDVGQCQSRGKGKGKGNAPPPPPQFVTKPSSPAPTRLPTCITQSSRPLVDLRNVTLQKTETRVRTRDGTILTETRSADGTGFEAVVVGKDATRPRYLVDQESGLSRLEPRVFDSHSSRWVVTSTFSDVESQAGEASDASADTNRQLFQQGSFKLTSYNVWFNPCEQRRRAEALFLILSFENADVICLQEVTKPFLDWLREEVWVRERYAISDSVGTTLRGSTLVYGVIMLVRRTIAVRSLCLHEMPTSMNRAVLVASIPFGGLELRIATAHLESLDNTSVRVQQLERIFQIVQDDTTSVGAGSISMLAGDMNFDADSSLEEAAVENGGFTDCWRVVKPRCKTAAPQEEEIGITMPQDDATGTSTRIDRVFIGPPPQPKEWSLVPKAMTRLGMEPIGLPDSPNIRPSDHFGLSCEFTLRCVEEMPRAMQM